MSKSNLIPLIVAVTLCATSSASWAEEPIAGEITFGAIPSKVSANELFEEGFNFGISDEVISDNDLCDDPRFKGGQMSPSETLSDDNIGRDARDCFWAYVFGNIDLADDTPRPQNGLLFDGIDFGFNYGSGYHNGLCQDPRFEGPPAETGEDATIDYTLRDADDCMMLYMRRSVWLASGN